jgi:hypothetical protein
MMKCYDVAFWLTPFSRLLDYLAYVQADAASIAAVAASDGLCRRWWDMECSESEVGCEMA